MAQTNSSHDAEKNTYVIDTEHVAEMARLLDQERLLTEAMGGPFSERDKEEMTDIQHILDIACGPGGWVLDVARTYPHVDVTGIDISKAMINYAQAQAVAQQISNAHFQVMSAMEPLAFADNSFDIVNARAIVGFMPRRYWPTFVQECKRILRPKGVLRLTEIDLGFGTTPAFETLMSKGIEAIFRVGQSFSGTGRHLGITPVLGRLLREAKFEHIQTQAYAIDHSYGTKAYKGFTEDYRMMFALGRDFLLRTKVVTPAEFDQLYVQALEELQSPEFCALGYLLNVWGEKPAEA